MSTILLKPVLRFRAEDVKTTAQNFTVRIAEQFGAMNTARKHLTFPNNSGPNNSGPNKTGRNIARPDKVFGANELSQLEQRSVCNERENAEPVAGQIAEGIEGRIEFREQGPSSPRAIRRGSVEQQETENRFTASALVKKSESSESEIASGTGAEISEERSRDLLLVARVQSGDSDAYRELVELYQSRAQAISIGLLGNFDDAQDLVQQAFLKAYRSIGSFRGQSSFYTWLYRILVNLSIDLSRKAYRKSEQGFDDSKTVDALAQKNTTLAGEYLGHLDTPDEHLRRVELRQRLHLALSSLSEEHRTVIVLREIDGLSYTEISDAVGCSKGTVMSRLHHARKKLQSTLSDLMPEGTQNSEDSISSELVGSKSGISGESGAELIKTSSTVMVEE